MDDPYKVLGVARGASAAQIKSAYRKLARELHPDLHPEDAAAEERFKQIGGAYDLLSDPVKRARYDAGEIDASGAERGPRRGARRPWGTGSSADDLWGEAMRRAGRGRRFPFDVEDDESPVRGQDVHYKLSLGLAEAALGVMKRITLPGGRSLDVRVPAGSREGSVLRLKGQGRAGQRKGEAGDALVEIRVEPHPLFTRNGDDIEMTLPVTLPEAVLGAKVTVPTLDGRVTVSIPAGSNSGTVLRLRGKGVPGTAGAGDQLVRLQVMLPERPDPDLEAFLRKWAASHPYEVREPQKA